MKPLEKVKWMAMLARDHELSDSAVRVGNILADRQNGQTGQCNPALETLVAETGLSRRSVQYGIKALIARGHVQMVKQGNGKGNRAEYELVKGANPAPLKGANNAPLQNTKGAKNDSQRVQKTTPKGAKNDIPPTPPYKEEPVKEPVKGTCEGSDGAQKTLPIDPPKTHVAKEPPVGAETWDAYATAYRERYGVDPVRNAGVNSQIANFVKRIGREEAPGVARYFVASNNAYYVRRGHSTGAMLADAEKLRMEWATGRHVTATQAQQIDRTQSNANAAHEAIEILRRRGGQSHG